MIEAPTLFDTSAYDTVPEDWCSDDWETPDPVARAMAGLLLPSDKRVLEPAAGTGQIAKFIGGDRILFCNELNPLRFEVGQSRVPSNIKRDRTRVIWTNGDFLKHETHVWYDCIIGNPPFSLGMEFLEMALRLLNPDNPDAHILFLLPSAFFQSKGRGDRLQSLPCRVHQVHASKGRIAYLQNGKALSGRQCDDSVFDIRRGDGSAGWVFLDV